MIVSSKNWIFGSIAPDMDIEDPTCPPHVLRRLWDIQADPGYGRSGPDTAFDLEMRRAILRNPNTPGDILVTAMIQCNKWAWQNPIAPQLAMTNPSYAMTRAARLMEEEAKVVRSEQEPEDPLARLQNELRLHSDSYNVWLHWWINSGRSDK